MGASKVLIQSLKRCMKAKGLTYRQLAEGLGLSEASVKRIFSRQTFTLDRLEQILGVLDMDFFELAKMSQETAGRRSHGLSTPQEQALADDFKFFAYFYLLLSGLDSARIVKNYRISERESVSYLHKLDKLRLIALLPGNRVRLLVARNFKWQRNGPLTKAFDPSIKKEFLQSEFNQPNEYVHIVALELSESSLRLLKRKIELLTAEMTAVSEADETVLRGKGHKVWLMNAYRPWVFSEVLRLRR